MSDDLQTARSAFRKLSAAEQTDFFQDHAWHPGNQKMVIAEYMNDQEAAAQNMDEIDSAFATKARNFGTTLDQRKARGMRDYRWATNILGKSYSVSTREQLVKGLHKLHDSEFERIQKVDKSVDFHANALKKEMERKGRLDEYGAFLQEKCEQIETPQIRGVTVVRRN